jgi:D-alanyl-D-alanine-carboxypeptidase/D-alanyl-D-alanine-endopeptidase
MTPEELGIRISELRNERALTQQELAAKAQLNIRSIQRLESGKVKARVYTLKAIARALEVDLNDLCKMDSSIQKDFSRFWIVMLHLSSIIPIVVVALLIWVFKRDEIPGFDKHAKAVLNFQITYCIYLFAASFMIFLVIGLIILPFLGIFICFLAVLNATRTSMDKEFSYPFTYHFIR